MKKALHSDLTEKYENPTEHTCDMPTRSGISDEILC